MQRKGTNGRFLPEFKAVVVAWVRDGDGLTYSDASREWGVKTEHIRRWCKSEDVDEPTGFGVVGSPKAAGGGGEAPSRKGKNPPHLTGGKHRAPVEDMGAEDRDRAVATVRSIDQILSIKSAMILEQLKRAAKLMAHPESLGPEERAEAFALASVDVKSAQGLLHLARAKGITIDTHPGLMKLAGIKERTGDGERKLDAVAAALGLTVGDT